MTTFTIYPKEGGKDFKADLGGFEIADDGQIILQNTIAKKSDLAMLVTDTVAAIIPEQIQPDKWGESENQITYLVYLKDRTEEPIKIYAGAFDVIDSLVQFFWLVERAPGYEREPLPIRQIYVPVSEIVGIFPEGGLVTRRWHLEK